MRQKMVHGQQRVDLSRTEPQARQRLAGRFVNVRVIPVTAEVSIPHNGCADSVAEILKVTANRCPRDLEVIDQLAQ